MLLAVISAYLVVVIAVRVDDIFLPGNEIWLPSAFRSVPGLSVAVAGIESDMPAGAPAGRINVLVLGLDRRPSEDKEPTRSDSMFVLTLDPTNKIGAVLSIPRDLWLEIPDGRGGYFQDRINTAYRWGGLNNYRGGAMQAARDAIEHNFPQITVDYAVAIDFSSFVKIVDSIGGVDIQITEGFRYLEPVSVDDRNGVIPEFRPGLEHMNGERALYYSRFRDGPDGDFGRIRRQQQVMVAVATKLISLGALTRAPEMWSRYKDAVETDIPAYRIPGLALLAKQVGLDHVTMRSLGEVVRDMVTPGGADVLVADGADMARVVGELFYDPRLRHEAATVEIENATERLGLARATASLFTRRGLPALSIHVSQETPTGYDETVILSYRGKSYTAERLAEWLDVPRSRIRVVDDVPPVPGGPDLIVILGRDAKFPQTAGPGASSR